MGSGVIAPTFLILVSGQFHVTVSFTSGERVTDTHWIGGSVGPRAGLNAVEKRKIFPLLGIKPKRDRMDWYGLD
jgi:hypothetical protein